MAFSKNLDNFSPQTINIGEYFLEEYLPLLQAAGLRALGRQSRRGLGARALPLAGFQHRA